MAKVSDRKSSQKPTIDLRLSTNLVTIHEAHCPARSLEMGKDIATYHPSEMKDDPEFQERQQIERIRNIVVLNLLSQYNPYQSSEWLERQLKMSSCCKCQANDPVLALLKHPNLADTSIARRLSEGWSEVDLVDLSTNQLSYFLNDSAMSFFWRGSKKPNGLN